MRKLVRKERERGSQDEWMSRNRMGFVLLCFVTCLGIGPGMQGCKKPDGGGAVVPEVKKEHPEGKDEDVLTASVMIRLETEEGQLIGLYRKEDERVKGIVEINGDGSYKKGERVRISVKGTAENGTAHGPASGGGGETDGEVDGGVVSVNNTGNTGNNTGGTTGDDTGDDAGAQTGDDKREETGAVQHRVVGYYFGYTEPGGYDVKSFPKERAGLLPLNPEVGIGFVMQSSITVYVVVEEKVIKEEEEPVVQKEPFKLVPGVDEGYWRAQNRKAWDLIHPKIVRLSEEEEDEIIRRYVWRLDKLYPALDEVLHTDTLYTGEPNMMSYRIMIKESNGNDDPAWTIRMAYALADMNGNIVQIYPPFRQSTYPMPVNWVAFVDLPEGDYIQKVLINIQEEPDKWYDLRMHDMITHSHIAYTKAIRERVENGLGIKVETPLKQSELYYNERNLVRHVVARKSQSTPPIPSWHHAVIKDETGKEWRYANSAAITLFGYHDNSITVKLSNKSNAYRKGRVYACLTRKHWIMQNIDMAKFIHKALLDIYYKGVNLVGQDKNFEEFIYPLGSEEVIFRGEETVQAVIRAGDIKKALYMAEHRYGLDELPGCKRYIVFFWQPDGEDKLYFMTRDFSAVLNRIQERTDVPFGEWWTGSPGKFKPNAIWIDGVENDHTEFPDLVNRNPEMVFEEEQPDYTNGNGLFVQ